VDFAERYECKPVLLGLSLAGNLVKPWDRMEGARLWTLYTVVYIVVASYTAVIEKSFVK